jgi:ParB family chromosome partitioning protein
MLKPTQIKIPSYRARKNINELELKFLADSIAACGIIEPLTVRKSENGNFELISGERRLKAAMKAGLRRVPCVVHSVNDLGAIIYSACENLQKKTLTPFEESDAISHLMFHYGISQTELCGKLGFNVSELCDKLRIGRLSDEIKYRIVTEKLPLDIAFELLRLDYGEREAALNKIICEGYNVKQAHQYINGIIYPPMDFGKGDESLLTEKTVPKPVAEEKQGRQTVKTAIGDMRLFSNSLAKLVETLNLAGVDAKCRKNENEKYVEFKVKIKKDAVSADTATQLRIC